MALLRLAAIDPENGVSVFIHRSRSVDGACPEGCRRGAVALLEDAKDSEAGSPLSLPDFAPPLDPRSNLVGYT